MAYRLSVENITIECDSADEAAKLVAVLDAATRQDRPENARREQGETHAKPESK